MSDKPTRTSIDAAVAAAQNAPRLDGSLRPLTNSGIPDQVGGTNPLGGWTDRPVTPAQRTDPAPGSERGPVTPKSR